MPTVLASFSGFISLKFEAEALNFVCQFVKALYSVTCY